MLLNFRVSNYKAFKNAATLDMRAGKSNEHEKTHLLKPNGQRLLKSAAIYGKNAAGKSTLLEALDFMKDFVIESSKDKQSSDPIGVSPFRLSTETKDAPSFFQVEFLLEDKRYRYGFEVTKERIEKEWLLVHVDGDEVPMFLRLADDFEIDFKLFKEGKSKEKWTRKNALFLSLVAQLNGEVSQKIIEWFNRLVFVHHVCDCEEDFSFTIELLATEAKYKSQILNLIKTADVDIEDIELILFNESKSKKTGKKIESPYENSVLLTYHKVFDKNNEVAGQEEFNMYEDESDGTIRYFNLVGFMVDALEKGEIIIMDELDVRLHSKLALAIVQLFNSLSNTKSQFIFTTHDDNLMHAEILRSDQIYFVEKGKYSDSALYSLAEFKMENEDFQKEYWRGRFGAIPFINNLSDILERNTNGKKEEPTEQT